LSLHLGTGHAWQNRQPGSLSRRVYKQLLDHYYSPYFHHAERQQDHQGGNQGKLDYGCTQSSFLM
jgi:hypothetical protein